MFHIPVHTEPHFSVEVHPHPDMPNMEHDGTPHPAAPISMTPGPDFSALGESGQHSGLLASLFAPVALPGEPSGFYMKSNFKPGPQPLYTRNPQTGVYMQSSKQAVPDGKSGWQRDDGLKGGLPLTPEQREERLRKARTAHQQAETELSTLQDAVIEARYDVQNATDTASRQAAHADLIAAINAHSTAVTTFRTAQQELANALAT
jgi:hypothetical protein